MDVRAIEGHYLETVGGLFFAVKGAVHPPDRFIAYLRYAPDEDGDRHKGDRSYRRLYHFAEQEDLLRREHPGCLFFEPTLDAVLQGVPHRLLKQVYDPRSGLAELLDRTGPDCLEEDALALARLIREQAGIPWEAIGLSGSPLIGLHNPQSDIDLLIYGAEHCQAARNALHGLLERSQGGLSYLDRAALQRLYAARVEDTRMSWEDFARHESRKTFQGLFRGRDYFIRYLKAPDENREAYGDRRYRAHGRAVVRARVVAGEDGIFTPCSYPVCEVEVIERSAGPDLPAADLREIASFRGRFCEQAGAGDTVVASGKLEHVLERGGGTYYRLLLGEQREDYIITEV